MLNPYNKKPEQKIKYIYTKPKNGEEAKEAQRRLDRAFDILFTEVDRRLRERASGSKK